MRTYSLCFGSKIRKNCIPLHTPISPAENKFDLELSSKVFFFTEFCSVDIAFEESE